MSLNMYLNETDTQTNSMNSMCIETIQAMEQVQRSITSFYLTFSLRGQTYDSAKKFMVQIYYPLAQGIIYLCEELIRQNDNYPTDFRSQVATTDVVEEEIRAQIDELNRLIEQMRAMSDTLSLFSTQIYIYEKIKQALEEKLINLYLFNSTSSNNYVTAMELASSVMDGLTQIQDQTVFNSSTGVFSTDEMDMNWVADLQETYYTRKAKDKYSEYLEKYPNNLEKVIEIVKYEDKHPDDAEKTSTFLSELEQRDVIEIKYLMYTAEEPYRTVSLKYLDRFSIGGTEESGVFKPSKDAVYFDIEKERNNSRGNYYTVFHEIMHAADYYHGIDQGYDGYFSDYYKRGTKTLNDHMYEDAETHFRQELANIVQTTFKNIDEPEKQLMIDNVTNNLMNQDYYYGSLTPPERIINNKIREHYKEILNGAEHNTASDVYGGITNYTITGNYGHFDDDGNPTDYWFEGGIGGPNEERVREPNREGIAEYFGREMTEDGPKREDGLSSIDEYLPNSKKYMDEIFEEIAD